MALTIPFMPVWAVVISLLLLILEICVFLVWLILLQSCWWDFMGMVSDISGRYNLTAHSMIIWLLKSFFALLHNDSWAIGAGDCGRCILWVWALQFCILIVVFFCPSQIIFRQGKRWEPSFIFVQFLASFVKDSAFPRERETETESERQRQRKKEC